MDENDEYSELITSYRILIVFLVACFVYYYHQTSSVAEIHETSISSLQNQLLADQKVFRAQIFNLKQEELVLTEALRRLRLRLTSQEDAVSDLVAGQQEGEENLAQIMAHLTREDALLDAMRVAEHSEVMAGVRRVNGAGFTNGTSQTYDTSPVDGTEYSNDTSFANWETLTYEEEALNEFPPPDETSLFDEIGSGSGTTSNNRTRPTNGVRFVNGTGYTNDTESITLPTPSASPPLLPRVDVATDNGFVFDFNQSIEWVRPEDEPSLRSPLPRRRLPLSVVTPEEVASRENVRRGVRRNAGRYMRENIPNGIR